MTSALKKIRQAICARAEGACEHCGAWVGLNGEDGELDHAAGRGKGREPESVSNCWLLCGGERFRNDGCHFKKTNSKPDAAYWLVAFISHCGKYGYDTSRAEARLAFVQARAALRRAS